MSIKALFLNLLLLLSCSTFMVTANANPAIEMQEPEDPQFSLLPLTDEHPTDYLEQQACDITISQCGSA